MNRRRKKAGSARHVGRILPAFGLAVGLFEGNASAQRLGPPVLFEETLRRPSLEAPNLKEDFLLEADEILYERDLEIVTARGSVEVSQGERVIKADVLSYDRKLKRVTASGHVVILEPSGDRLFSDYLQISDDFADAVMENFKALLVDNSRIVAKGAVRISGNRTIMTRAVFSPCALCREDPSKPPLWQIKGRRLVHDETTKDLEYRDATLEIAGVPAFYLPYFVHPDPSVHSRSGLLAPTLGYHGRLGLILGTPYYGILDKSSDVTFEPRLYSKEAILGGGEYRRRFDHGKFRLAGSLLKHSLFDAKDPLSDRDWGGNLATEGYFDLGDHWRAGWEAARVSDRTYIRRYKLGPDFTGKGRHRISNALISTAFTEGFYGRSYFNVSNFAFQTLRAQENHALIAKIHPAALASLVSEADRLGGRWKFESDFLSLSRKRGTDSARLATTTGYHVPLITDSGHVFTAAATIRADAYSVTNLALDNNHFFSGEETRLYPQLATSWTYPLIRRQTGGSFLIEPKIGVVLGPKNGNKIRIPNEDSRIVELDDVNLFLPRRFPGRDRIDSGSRVDYGVRMGMTRDGGASASAIVGQSYRLLGDAPYPKGSGLDKRESDIVTAVKISPYPWIDYNYRLRLDSITGQIQREETGVSLYRDHNSLSLTYVNYNQFFPEIGIETPRMATATGQIQLSNLIRLYGLSTYDLQKDRLITGGLGLLYEDECTAILGSYTQDKFLDRSLHNDRTVFIRIALKYLGEIGL